MFPAITLSCRDHEGGGGVKFQQWDGKQWTVLTDWMAPISAGAAPGGGIGGQVCAGEGDHTTSLPVGAWSLWSGGRAPWEEEEQRPGAGHPTRI